MSGRGGTLSLIVTETPLLSLGIPGLEYRGSWASSFPAAPAL